MAALKSWLAASRVRTLPLAVSGLLLGNLIAASQPPFNFTIAILSVITAVLLQILSNLANDYGDFVNGADNEERVGPKRLVQSGAISASEMKNGIILLAALSLLSGIGLLLSASDVLGWKEIIIMLSFGLFAIVAAITYTASKKPYGYAGMGDLSVLIFFGIVSVCGSYFLQKGDIYSLLLLPALGFGALATGVLNLNNMRDIENDKNSGKITVAVRLGLAKAKVYHLILILSGGAFMAIFAFINFEKWWQFLFLAPVLLLFQHLRNVFIQTNSESMDPYLKDLALKTSLYSISIGIGLLV